MLSNFFSTRSDHIQQLLLLYPLTFLIEPFPVFILIFYLILKIGHLSFVYITVTSKKPIELERHCQNLEDELDIVKKEILKILSEKSKCSKENAELKKALQVTIGPTVFMLTSLKNQIILREECNFLLLAKQCSFLVIIIIFLNLHHQTDLSMTLQHDAIFETSNTQILDPKKIQDRYSPDGQVKPKTVIKY